MVYHSGYYKGLGAKGVKIWASQILNKLYVVGALDSNRSKP